MDPKRLNWARQIQAIASTSAHDVSDFVVEVMVVSPSSLLIARGAVVCKASDETVTLANTPSAVYRIVLDVTKEG